MVRSVMAVMAVLALEIFPGLTAAQEPVLQASQRATLEEVVRFDFDEATITTETDETEEFLRAKLPILRSSAVLEAYGLVKVGDLVRPAPVFDLRPGEYPAMAMNRTEATVIEFGEVHQLYGLRQVTILDKGSLDGLDIGDEYVAFYGDGSTEQVIGRLRVVLTEEETSSAEIVTVEGAVFQVGTTVYLDRKMR
jgi:hypothetical protein